ncbi:protease inhibitor I42 family protein [Chlorobium phaeobacteroides]|nr:protease inhibitor I42 family protein [Chlorobium phaeobacteroides]
MPKKARSPIRMALYLFRTALPSALCFIFFMIAVSCSGYQKASNMTHDFVEKDNDRTVDIRSGDTVRITLPENASTGYRWAVDRSDEEVMTMLSSDAHYTAKAVGAGGEVVFIFEAKKNGAGEVVLKNWRSWEGDSSVTDRFRIRVNVLP